MAQQPASRSVLVANASNRFFTVYLFKHRLPGVLVGNRSNDKGSHWLPLV